MRFRITFVIAFISASAFAVAPQFWRVNTTEEFLAGDIEGFAVTSRGELRPAVAVNKVVAFTDPFVLSQVAAPNGDRYFGTGNDGKLYRLRGQELKAIHTAPEPEIYALAFQNGSILAATSPNGKVYRIDPERGTSSVFFDPKQAYIWALHLLPGGELLVATGVEGKLFRVSAAGEGKVLFDAPETHLRSLAVRKDGRVLAGGSGKGRIYEVRKDGAAHALFDSSLSEISAIYVDGGENAWAAGAASVLPTTAPAKPAGGKSPQPQASGSSSSGSGAQSEAKKEETPSSAEAAFSFDDGASSAQAGSGELYRIHPDGFVEIARKFEREMIYAISSATDGSLLLATGPQGRIYRYEEGEIALLATVPEKQIVSISSTGESMFVTTTNSGALYRIGSAPSARAEFRSVAKDVERFSRFGSYRIEGTNVENGALAISFRSGNTQTPDATWSSWTPPSTTRDGAIAAPPGRYLQWKLTTPRPTSGLAVDAVSIAFMNRNVKPVIDSVAVQDPAVVFIGSSFPASPQVVEATNPDEYGIFSSLDSPRDKSDPGKRAFRKGYRTITWRAHDDNGDSLRYALFFRMRGAERWLRLREQLDETQLNFDTSQLPDGAYQVRLVASDATDNPEHPLNDTKEGVEFQVDNSAPSIAVTASGDEVTVRIRDTYSPIGKVEYSADAQRWVRLNPSDGIADSPDETYRLKRSLVNGKFVIVRAVDSFYNVATESIALE